MPAPMIDKLVDSSGKSKAEVEKAWDKAKEITSDTFDKKEADFGDKEWSYVTGTAKNILGIKESINNIMKFDLNKFLKSKLNAKQYIEETMTSASLGAITSQMISNVDDKAIENKDERISAEEIIKKETDKVEDKKE
jgi:hypothetical protein